MKVMAINSSPRTGSGESKTEMMLNSLISGMRQAGAEVNLVHLRDKKVRYCQGCFSCWTKTPGICIHKDDMTNELFPMWIESDLAVYASPLYHFHINAHMKTFIERTLPMLEPYLVQDDKGVTHHPLRYEKIPGTVLLSVAGFPEMNIFDQLSSWARYIFKTGLMAEIYRPAAELLVKPQGRDKAPEILHATEQAGKELVESGAVADRTMDKITQPLGNTEDIGALANMFWRTCISRGITPREANKQNLLPTPGSLEDMVLLLPAGFDGAAAGDMDAIIQYDFSGPVEGSCHFKIKGGKMTGALGIADDPTLTITTDFDLWVDILTGKVEGQEAFMQGKAKASGDLGPLMRLSQLFSGN